MPICDRSRLFEDSAFLLFPIECQRTYVFGTQVVEQERSVCGIEAHPITHPSSVWEASQIDHPLGSTAVY